MAYRRPIDRDPPPNIDHQATILGRKHPYVTQLNIPNIAGSGKANERIVESNTGIPSQCRLSNLLRRLCLQVRAIGRMAPYRHF